MNPRKRSTDRTFLALAMRRSGHHAVLNQLCHQLADVIHLNNCVIRGFPRRARPVAGRFRRYHGTEVVDTGVQSHRNYLKAMSKAPFTSNLMYSFEDADLDLDYTRFVEPSLSKVILCVVRDPFNWLASSVQFGGTMVREIDRRIELWKRQVQFCLNPEDYPYGRFVDISFNRWVSELGYRIALSDRLGLQHCEAGRDEVIVFGVGSSFDGDRFDGCATRMEVLERWRGFSEDAQYRSLLEDQELLDLSEQYFQFNPFSR